MPCHYCEEFKEMVKILCALPVAFITIEVPHSGVLPCPGNPRFGVGQWSRVGLCCCPQLEEHVSESWVEEAVGLVNNNSKFGVFLWLGW